MEPTGSQPTARSVMFFMTVGMASVLDKAEIKKILIVDDEPDLLDVLSFVFEGSGWKTSTALNGKVALEKIEQMVPDVILSDINMPEMNGLKLLEELHNKES